MRLLGFFESSGVSNDTQLTATNATAIAVGQVIVCAAVRGSTGTLNGITSIVDASGNTWTQRSLASRASTFDLAIWTCTVTTAIPASSTFTITWANVGTRKAAIFSVWDDLGVVLGTSGNPAGALGTVAADYNGSSGTQNADIAASVAGIMFAAFSMAGSATTSPVGMTAISSIKTATGSGDRGVCLAYSTVAVAAPQSLTSILSASQGWASTAIAVDASVVVPPAATVKVVVGGVKKTGSPTVIVGGTKKTVTTVSVIIGEAKKSLA